jgi:hypothetical protein
MICRTLPCSAGKLERLSIVDPTGRPAHTVGIPTTPDTENPGNVKTFARKLMNAEKDVPQIWLMVRMIGGFMTSLSRPSIKVTLQKGLRVFGSQARIKQHAQAPGGLLLEAAATHATRPDFAYCTTTSARANTTALKESVNHCVSFNKDRDRK